MDIQESEGSISETAEAKEPLSSQKKCQHGSSSSLSSGNSGTNRHEAEDIEEPTLMEKAREGELKPRSNKSDELASIHLAANGSHVVTVKVSFYGY